MNYTRCFIKIRSPKNFAGRKPSLICYFLFCGMPFADLAHLEKSNLEGNILKYNRIKTGTPMSIEILESASCIVSRLRNTHSVVLPEHPDYLFIY